MEEEIAKLDEKIEELWNEWHLLKDGKKNVKTI